MEDIWITETLMICKLVAVSSRMFFNFLFSLERNRCLVNPCRNGGICSNDEKKPVCRCREGFVAEFCQGITTHD